MVLVSFSPSRSTDTDKSGYLSENEIKGGGGGTWRSFVSLTIGVLKIHEPLNDL